MDLRGGTHGCDSGQLATGVPIVYVLDAEGRPVKRTDYETGVAHVTAMAG